MMENTSGRIRGVLCALMLAAVHADVAHAGETGGIPPELVAEYIYAVIQADRSIYSTHVVEQLQDRKVAVAAEDWKEKGALPLPAQLLQMAGQEVQGLGLGLHIRLSSLGPIYTKNARGMSLNEQVWKRWPRIPASPIRVLLQKVTDGISKRYLRIVLSLRLVSCATTVIPSARSGTISSMM